MTVWADGMKTIVYDVNEGNDVGDVGIWGGGHKVDLQQAQAQTTLVVQGNMGGAQQNTDGAGLNTDPQTNEADNPPGSTPTAASSTPPESQHAVVHNPGQPLPAASPAAGADSFSFALSPQSPQIAAPLISSLSILSGAQNAATLNQVPSASDAIVTPIGRGKPDKGKGKVNASQGNEERGVIYHIFAGNDPSRQEEVTELFMDIQSEVQMAKGAGDTGKCFLFFLSLLVIDDDDGQARIIPLPLRRLVYQ